MARPLPPPSPSLMELSLNKVEEKKWLFQPKKVVENFFVKIRFRLFQDEKKNPMATKPRGGGKGLSGRATKKRIFFAASLIYPLLFRLWRYPELSSHHELKPVENCEYINTGTPCIIFLFLICRHERGFYFFLKSGE